MKKNVHIQLAIFSITKNELLNFQMIGKAKKEPQFMSLCMH